MVFDIKNWIRAVPLAIILYGLASILLWTKNDTHDITNYDQRGIFSWQVVNPVVKNEKATVYLLEGGDLSTTILRVGVSKENMRETTVYVDTASQSKYGDNLTIRWVNKNQVSINEKVIDVNHKSTYLNLFNP